MTINELADVEAELQQMRDELDALHCVEPVSPAARDRLLATRERVRASIRRLERLRTELA